MRRFAAIADVHGNRWALEAVLEDIARQGVRDIMNAGDHLFGPLDVAGTADLLIRLELPTVAGNQDREMLSAIDYDFKSAARSAGRNGRPDWAFRLRTGRAR